MYHGKYLVLYEGNSLKYSEKNIENFRGIIYEKIIE